MAVVQLNAWYFRLGLAGWCLWNLLVALLLLLIAGCSALPQLSDNKDYGICFQHLCISVYKQWIWIFLSCFQASLHPAVLPLHSSQLSMTGYTVLNNSHSTIKHNPVVCDDGFKTEPFVNLSFFFDPMVMERWGLNAVVGRKGKELLLRVCLSN